MSQSNYERLKELIKEGHKIQGSSSADILSFSAFIDPLILPVVEILNAHGFKTFESCQGGEGHCYGEPTVRFEGGEPDLIKAFEICLAYGLVALDAKRVFRKESVYINDGAGENNGMPIGEAWGTPFNEITFVIHSNTGTIFLPD